MNIIQAALRRIAIRKTERAILSGASAMAEGSKSADYSPNIPTFERTVTNVLFLGILLGLIVTVALFAIGPIGAILPLLFLGRVRNSFRGFAYGVKSEPVYKTDRRYTTGRRIEGYREVKDKSKVIKFTDAQNSIGRVDGSIKAIMILAAVGYILIHTLGDDWKVKHLTTKELFAIIQPGDTLYPTSASIQTYAKFKEKYLEGLDYDDVATFKGEVLGTLVKVDSVSKYKQYLVVKPFEELKYKEYTFRGWENRVDKLDYVKPEDVTVSLHRYRQSKQGQALSTK